jgi:hypothetical protein
MIRRYHMLSIICLGIAVTLLTGCGQNVIPGTTTSATATARPGFSATVIVMKKPTSSNTPPSLAKTPAATAPAGSVTLRIEPVSPHTHTAFVVLISNDSGQTIYFPDHQTNCTVILLERQVAGNWQPVNACRLMIVTRLLSLNTHQSLMVKLLPAHNGWVAGLYRASIHYPVSPVTFTINA